MQQDIDYLDNYSIEYRRRLAEALQESKRLGFTRDPLISEQTPVTDNTLREVSNMVTEYSALLDAVLPEYWGNSCQTLSTNFFAFLNTQGIPANIVIGNVIINGTDEFETTLDSVRKEVLAMEPSVGHQSIHAWISLGDDTIVDAALPPRIVLRYQARNMSPDTIFVGRASFLSAAYRVRYQPIIVGTEFFAKTNPPDPMDLLNEMRSRYG